MSGMLSSRIRQAAAGYLGTTAALLALVVLFSLGTRNFFSIDTFLNIANQSPAITIIAVGMTFVLLIGGIDLSVGSVLALCGAVLGTVLLQGFPIALPVAAALVGCGWAVPAGGAPAWS